MEELKPVLENIVPDWRRLVMGAENLYAHMEDSALVLLRAYGEITSPTFFLDDAFVQNYRDMRRALRIPPQDVLAGVGRAVTGTARSMHALCGAMLCRTICSRVSKTIPLTEEDVFAGQEDTEVILSQNKNRVVLLRNAMSADAFSRFCRVLPTLEKAIAPMQTRFAKRFMRGAQSMPFCPLKTR